MADDPRIGRTLANYRIDALLGRGGMGVVYLAEHVHLGRKAAVKVLAPEIAGDEAFRDRFVRESRLAAALDHPNIVAVYDAGEADGELYIAMRYISGTDLYRLLQSEGALDPARAVSIVGQIASALDAAHSHGLVHRDVKPANVMLSGLPGEEHAYLTDFGLTKRPGSQTGLTQTGMFLGTINYIAPEQIQGLEVDGRVDVYSLACVLYESLTGEVPYPRATDPAVIYAHLEDAPPAPSARRTGLPGGLDAVIATGMAKQRDDRYQKAGDLSKAATAAIRPSETPPTAEGARPVTMAAPPPAPARVPPTVAAPPAPPAPQPTEPAAPSRRRGRMVAVAAVVILGGLGAGLWALLGGGDGGVEPPGGDGQTPRAQEGEIVQLTDDPANDFSPAFSPDGTQIAFFSTRTDNEDVFVMNADGSEVTQLTDDPARDSAPVWSPDGSQIAFVSARDGDRNIFIMNADGTGVNRLTDHPGEDFAPEFFPDGSLIAFVSDRNGSRDIFLMNADGTDVKPLIAEAGQQFAPAFSPDGSQLAFVRENPDHDIFVLNVEGMDVVQVTANPNDDLAPEWSPDGTHIVFFSSRFADSEIFAVEVGDETEAGLIQITDDPADDAGPVFSPDGSQIAYFSDQNGNADIFSIGVRF